MYNYNSKFIHIDNDYKEEAFVVIITNLKYNVCNKIG